MRDYSLLKLQAIKIEAEINLKADHWELYHMPGRDQAAEQLNRALEQHLRTTGLAGVEQVLRPFSAFGATDSEGYNTLAWVLQQLGIDADQFI